MEGFSDFMLFLLCNGIEECGVVLGGYTTLLFILSQVQKLKESPTFISHEVMKNGSKNVDAYIARAPKEVQGKLRVVRSAIRKTAPTATESISYGIPCYDYKGRLAWFGLMKTHIGLYLRPPVTAEHKEELAGYEFTKSAVRFPLDKRIPASLITKSVRARIEKNETEE